MRETGATHPEPLTLKRSWFDSASPVPILALLILSGIQGAFPFCDRFTPSPAQVRTAEPRELVLTFDAAWTPEGAHQILDALRALDARATFFLAGRFVSAHPEVARRIVSDGHEVGNHTYNHRHLTQYAENGSRALLPDVDEALLARELGEAQAAFRSATGRDLAPLWRAPYGETNEQILAWTRSRGYRHVGWSTGLDTLDWVADPRSRLYSPPRSAVRRILRRLENRSRVEGTAVVLMHLGSERPPGERFAAALPGLIQGARNLGYRIVTAGDALSRGTLQ